MFNLLLWTKPAALKFVALKTWFASSTAQPQPVVSVSNPVLLHVILMKELPTAMPSKLATVVLV
jgi:hypothetical protein